MGLFRPRIGIYAGGIEVHSAIPALSTQTRKGFYVTVLTDRDLAYRAALGLGVDDPMPRALGAGGSSVRRAFYDADGGVRGATGPERTSVDDPMDDWVTFWDGRHVADARLARDHAADVRATRRGTLSDDELDVLHGRGPRVLGSPYVVSGGSETRRADVSRFGILPF
jgi:hypothetical protein